MSRKNGTAHQYEIWGTMSKGEPAPDLGGGLKQAVVNGELLCGIYAGDTPEEAISWAREEFGEHRDYRAVELPEVDRPDLPWPAQERM